MRGRRIAWTLEAGALHAAPACGSRVEDGRRVMSKIDWHCGNVPGFDLMAHTITVASRLPAWMRADLEALLFFNSRQHRVRHEIEQTIERFGAPEIVEHDGWLRVRVAGLAEVQSLFAMHEENGRPRPVGAVIYVRETFERITVVHVGVADDYAVGGPHARERVLLRLMQEIRRVARRTAGIERVELAYTNGRTRQRVATL